MNRADQDTGVCDVRADRLGLRSLGIVDLAVIFGAEAGSQVIEELLWGPM